MLNMGTHINVENGMVWYVLARKHANMRDRKWAEFALMKCRLRFTSQSSRPHSVGYRKDGNRRSDPTTPFRSSSRKNHWSLNQASSALERRFLHENAGFSIVQFTKTTIYM